MEGAVAIAGPSNGISSHDHNHHHVDQEEQQAQQQQDDDAAPYQGHVMLH